MKYKMRCFACGNRYIFVSNKVLKLPVRQECPKCKRWTGEPE